MRSLNKKKSLRRLACMVGVVLILMSPILSGAQGKTPSKVVNAGITMCFTGAEAEQAELSKDGALMAIEEVNANGGIAGYKIEPIILNNSTATASECDPAQAATNARKLVADSNVVANIGPQSSGEAKAMVAIFSEGDLATVTPGATNPDLTNPKFAVQFHPSGKIIFFRTVSTDAYVGPYMANLFAEKLHVRSVYLLDDSGAYGVGVVDSFQEQATKKGMRILGRDRLDPKEADYEVILTKIKGLNPDGLFYGGGRLAEVKMAKQAYDVIPNVTKGEADNIFGALRMIGFPAVDGWYVGIAAPYLFENPQVRPWMGRFVQRWGKQPGSYSIMAYDAALVIIDAMKRVSRAGRPVNRHTVRDAIQATRLRTLQGRIEFDPNGDLIDQVVSVFRVTHNPKYAEDDTLHQIKYLGVAPTH